MLGAFYRPICRMASKSAWKRHLGYPRPNEICTIAKSAAACAYIRTAMGSACWRQEHGHCCKITKRVRSKGCPSYKSFVWRATSARYSLDRSECCFVLKKKIRKKRQKINEISFKTIKIASMSSIFSKFHKNFIDFVNLQILIFVFKKNFGY